MWIGQLDTFSLAWIRLDFRLVIPRELSGLCQWTYLSITCSGLCSGTRRAGQPWVGSRKANSDCWVWKKREKKVGWLFSDGNLELWDPFSRGSLYTHTDTRLWTSKWWCGSIIKMRQEKRNYPQWVLRTEYSTSTLVHVSIFLFFFLLHWQGKWQDHHKYSSWNRSQNNNTNTEFTATYGDSNPEYVPNLRHTDANTHSLNMYIIISYYLRPWQRIYSAADRRTHWYKLTAWYLVLLDTYQRTIRTGPGNRSDWLYGVRSTEYRYKVWYFVLSASTYSVLRTPYSIPASWLLLPGEADPTTDCDLPRKVRSAQIPSSRKTSGWVNDPNHLVVVVCSPAIIIWLLHHSPYGNRSAESIGRITVPSA